MKVISTSRGELLLLAAFTFFPMKMTPDFRNRVLAGEFLAGTFLNLGSSLTAEMAGLAGFDWLMLDYEHGAGSEMTLLHQLQAVAATPAMGVVRIAANEPPRFKRVLDAGAHGVMIPYVSSAAEMKAAIAALRYPPHGQRGVAKLNRAAAFGSDFDAYFARSHECIVSMPQIETLEGVQAVDEIAAVDGADVLFVGPLDLTSNMGISGNYSHPDFIAILKKVAASARRAGKAAGILALDPSHVGPWREMGYSVMALGSDGGGVNASLRANAALLKRSG